MVHVHRPTKNWSSFEDALFGNYKIENKYVPFVCQCGAKICWRPKTKWRASYWKRQPGSK